MNSENINNSSPNSDEISLKELILKMREWWKYLLSKWVIIAVFGLLGGLSGLIYAYIKKPVYIATTTFVLEDEKSSSGGLSSLSGLASMAGVDLGGSGGGIFQGDNIFELYKSRKMIEKTLLSSLGDDSGKLLIDRYIFINNLKEIWSKKQGLNNLEFNGSSLDAHENRRLRDSVLGAIVADVNANYLTVAKPDKKLSIIKVDVKSTDEVFAKGFNDQIVKNVNDFYVQTKTKKSLDNVSILQHKTDSVRAVMNGAIYSAAAVTDATPNLNPTRQTQRVAPVQRAQFSAETNKTVLAALVQNLEMSKMALLKETPLIQVVDQPIFPLQIDRFGKAKGIMLGGMITLFFIVITLLLKKVVDSIMA